MKHVKKSLTLGLASVFLAAAIIPAVLSTHQEANNMQVASNQPTSVTLATLTPNGSNSSAYTLPTNIDGMNDIAHNTNHISLNHWLNNSQIKNILTKAQQNGRLGYVMAKLQSMNLPKSLAFIPVIESHYSPGAISNKGASGIWQLMPATAKRFGLTNMQRYQLAPSTDAALKYFKTLYQKFGSWELAIAAYNAGEGRIQQALNKNPTATSVQQLNLPTETKQYVLKFYMLEDYAATQASGSTSTTA